MSGRGDAGRDHATLEHNVARLVRQAYVPVRPAPAFRTDLTAMVRAEIRRLHVPPSTPSRRTARMVAVAAAVLALSGLVAWLVRAQAADPGSAPTTVADDGGARRQHPAVPDVPRGAAPPAGPDEAATEVADAGSPGRVPVAAEGDGSTKGETTASDAEAGADLHLRVTDAETGLPIPTVTLARIPARRQNEVDPVRRATSTAPDGAHVLAGAFGDGTFAPAVYAEGYALWTGAYTGDTPDAPRTLAVALRRGGSVRGYVVDAAIGSGVAGAVVTPRADTPAASVSWDLRDPEPWLPCAATTAADGGFVLSHVSAGTHVLHVAAPGYAPLFLEDVVVEEGSRVELEPAALAPEAVLTGMVADVDGAPAAGERVVVTPFATGEAGLEFFALAQTDAGGTYRFGQLPGGMLLTILVPRSADETPIVRPVQLRTGSEARLDFERAPRGTRVVGALRDADGHPLVRRNLALVRADRAASDVEAAFRASSTADDGSFRFEGIEPGHYELSVVAQEGGVLLVGELDVAGREVRADFRLGPGSLAGRVLRATDGEPVADVTVVLLAVDDAAGGPHFVAETATGQDGAWRVEGLRPGGFVAVAYPGPSKDPRARGLGHRSGPRVELGAGPAAADAGTLDLVDGGAAHLRVATTDGELAAERALLVTDGEGLYALPSLHATTDAKGELELPGLAPGTYRIQTLPVSASPAEEHTFRVRAGELTEVRLVLPRDA